MCCCCLWLMNHNVFLIWEIFHFFTLRWRKFSYRINGKWTNEFFFLIVFCNYVTQKTNTSDKRKCTYLIITHLWFTTKMRPLSQLCWAALKIFSNFCSKFSMFASCSSSLYLECTNTTTWVSLVSHHNQIEWNQLKITFAQKNNFHFLNAKINLIHLKFGESLRTSLKSIQAMVSYSLHD
jgi:hypothetical protein